MDLGRLFACILKALSVFTGGFVSSILAGAVGSQMSEFMCYPVSEGVVTHISVAVDEHAAAGQVREHGAGISGWHFEAKYSGRVKVPAGYASAMRSEEHTSELQSRGHLVCRLLLEKKKIENNEVTREIMSLWT